MKALAIFGGRSENIPPATFKRIMEQQEKIYFPYAKTIRS